MKDEEEDNILPNEDENNDTSFDANDQEGFDDKILSVWGVFTHIKR